MITTNDTIRTVGTGSMLIELDRRVTTGRFPCTRNDEGKRDDLLQVAKDKIAELDIIFDELHRLRDFWEQQGE